LAACAAVAYNFYGTPIVRFESPVANSVAFLFAMLLPLAALILGPGVGSTRLRVLLRVAVAPFALVGCVVALGTGAWLPDTIHLGRDPLFERMVVYPWGRAQLTLYRSNCGMPFCENDIMVVRAERRLLPGLLIVRDICSDGPSDSARLSLVPGRRVVLQLLAWRQGKPDSAAAADTCALPRRWSPPN